LDDVVKTTSKSKAVKPIDVGPAIDLVAAAEERLTAEQKNKMERRYGKVARAKKPSLPLITSFGEGPSKTKGKGIDPSNWGDANLNEEGLNFPDAQRAALDSIEQNRRKEPEKTRKTVENYVNAD